MPSGKKISGQFLAQAPGYAAGQSEQRPWGMWLAEDAGVDPKTGEEYCVKRIVVNSGGVLSLQSHDFRRENWTVVQGDLEVTLDGAVINLTQGESIDIPVKAVHRMANRTDQPVVVREFQFGICREGDIYRYEDVYGRAEGALSSSAAPDHRRAAPLPGVSGRSVGMGRR